MRPEPEPEGPRVYTVAQVARGITRTLERTFARPVLVQGEATGVRSASSGHVYFALKDAEAEATLDAVIYRSSLTPRMRAVIKDGALLRVRGVPSFWAPRGRIQLVADRAELAGRGAILEALERLKEKLAAEGLFEEGRKRALPSDPRVVGVITSRAGAVIHDICKVAFRRGGARVLLAPAAVQGQGAASSIVRALEMLTRVPEVDVVIIARGGGSQDDLLAFSDEALVRAVAACPVPVVSAVGHQTDVPLVDFAADRRAATPSQAAELVVPDRAGRRRMLDERTRAMRRAMELVLSRSRARAHGLASELGDPRISINHAQQLLDELGASLAAYPRGLERRRRDLMETHARLVAAHPRQRLQRDRARVVALQTRLVDVTRPALAARRETVAELAGSLVDATRPALAARRGAVAELAGRLDAMSPLKVLSRGYAIVTRGDGAAVRAASEVSRGDALTVRVGRGSFEAEVTRVDAGDGADAPPPEGEP